MTEKDIIEFLNANGFFVWRNQSGSVQLKGNRHMRLAPEGTSDVIGFHKTTGLIVAIERKSSSYKETVKAKQQEFIEMVKQAGGIAGVARSIEDVQQIIENAKFSESELPTVTTRASQLALRDGECQPSACRGEQ